MEFQFYVNNCHFSFKRINSLGTLCDRTPYHRNFALCLRKRKFIRNLLQIIEENLSDPEFTVVDLSRQMGMSQSQLSRKLTDITNYTPGKLIKEKRIKAAAQLIRRSDMRVSEIQYIVGFSGRGPFIDNFKKHYKQTPSEYARTLRSR